MNKTCNYAVGAFVLLSLLACEKSSPVQDMDEQEEEQPVVIDVDDVTQFTQLYWADEFDDDQLNEQVWWIQNTDSYNNELQCYKHAHERQNVYMGVEPITGNRCMVISAKRDTCSEHGKFFTSGKVSTQVGDWKEWVSTTYGRVEASIMLPKTYKGLWPAFWMMGTDVGNGVSWAACGEIDILEVGAAAGYTTVEKSESYINGACHWGSGWENGQHWNNSQFSTIDHSLQDGAFHTYTLVWTQKTIRCYVDWDGDKEAKPYFKLSIDRDKIRSYANNAPKYFHKPFYLMFNLAVGGDYPNIKDPALVSAMELEGGHAEMYVDWVRVYHAADEAYHTPYVVE